MTGSVGVVDAQQEYLRDSRTNLGSAINGKVVGLFDNYNTWGTGMLSWSLTACLRMNSIITI
jgi:hypothetical protein